MTHSSAFDFYLGIVELVLKTALVVGVGSVVAAAFRRKNPSASHFAWVLAFVATLAIPVCAWFAPDSGIVYLNIRPAAAIVPSDQAIGPVKPSEIGTTGYSNHPHPTREPNKFDTETLSELSSAPANILIGFAVWLLGFLAVLTRIAIGVNTLRVIRKYGTRGVQSDSTAELAERLGRKAHVSRPWVLRFNVSPEIKVPMTWGMWSPTVLLPSDAENWTNGTLEAALLHELGHVKRMDFVSQLIAELACAVHWYNPAVWIGAQAMRSDAELATDSTVLRSGVKASDYATELLNLAGSIGPRRLAIAHLGMPVMNNSKIETRLESVLSPTARHRGLTHLEVVAGVVLACLAVPAIAGLRSGARPISESYRDEAERTEARLRMKITVLATIMYADDYDNVLPYVQQTASAVGVLNPYAKRESHAFESPTKGGKFLFNVNVGGVNQLDISDPAQSVSWFETLPNTTDQRAFGYVDGHVKLIDPADPMVKNWVSARFRRRKNSKPLPKDWQVSHVKNEVTNAVIQDPPRQKG